MTVTEVMDSDPFDPCGLSASVHFMVKIALGDRKDPILLFQPIELSVFLVILDVTKRICYTLRSTYTGGLSYGDWRKDTLHPQFARHDAEILLSTVRRHADHGESAVPGVEQRYGQGAQRKYQRVIQLAFSRISKVL